jgi:RecA-family ATPase
MEMEFPEPKWMVPKIIPEGLSILCGKPKIGKSILSLNLAVAVATGDMALGKIPVEKSGVLYLALEDSHRRLKERLKAVLQNGKPPENLIVSTFISSIQNGGIGQLNIWLKHHNDVGFVIIDTYARIKGKKSNNTDVFLDDYNELAKIKEVADSHNIGILLIHHTRKEVSEDVFDTVLGSTGITAAADTLIVLEKNKNVVNLHVRGRDVEEDKLELTFDSKTLSWMLVGDAGEYSLTGERKEIVDLLRDKGCSMKLKDIADAIGKKSDNVRHLLEKLMDVMDGGIFQPKHGEYDIKAS